LPSTTSSPALPLTPGTISDFIDQRYAHFSLEARKVLRLRFQQWPNNSSRSPEVPEQSCGTGSPQDVSPATMQLIDCMLSKDDSELAEALLEGNNTCTGMFLKL